MHARMFAAILPERAGVVLYALTLLAGCSRAPFFSLDNRTGLDVVVEYLDRDTWRKRAETPAGKVTEQIPISLEQRLRAGNCIYTYANSPYDVAVAQSRTENGGWGPPFTTYLTRLEADFTLRLFNASESGQPAEEVISDVWPARPQVDCRTKG